MTLHDVEVRMSELDAKRRLDIANDLTVSEQNELRDCEIALGMVAGVSAKVAIEAVVRLERFRMQRERSAK